MVKRLIGPRRGSESKLSDADRKAIEEAKAKIGVSQ
jgi:hypothetical protein